MIDILQEHYEKALAQSTAREDALVRTLQRKAEKVCLSASISSLGFCPNQLESVAAAVARMRSGGRPHAHSWNRCPDSHPVLQDHQLVGVKQHAVRLRDGLLGSPPLYPDTATTPITIIKAVTL